jgi:hypothetical protein
MPHNFGYNNKAVVHISLADQIEKKFMRDDPGQSALIMLCLMRLGIIKSKLFS